MSFFEFKGNVSPEQFVKTLEDVSSLRQNYKDRVDQRHGIDTELESNLLRRTDLLANALKIKQDDNTKVMDESKSYEKIRKLLTTGSYSDKVTYIYQENPDLIPQNPGVTEINYTDVVNGVGKLNKNNISVYFSSDDDEEKLKFVDDATLVEIPLKPKGKYDKYFDDNPVEQLIVSTPPSRYGLLGNLLLLDLRVLEHFDLLLNPNVKELELYVHIMSNIIGGISNSDKINKVISLINSAQPSAQKRIKPTGKLPVKPSNIAKHPELAVTPSIFPGKKPKAPLPPKQGVKQVAAPTVTPTPSTMVVNPSKLKQPSLKKIVLVKKATGLNSEENDDLPLDEEEELDESPVSRGGGKTKGKKSNSSYIIQAGKFGDLDVDMPLLYNKLHLLVKKGGNVLIDQGVDRDTLDILSHRYKPKKTYSDLSTKILTKMIGHSNYSVHPHSKKLQIAQNRLTKKREKKNAKANGVKYEDPTLERLITLIGEMNAGNDPNKELQQEIKSISDALLKVGKIDATLYKEIKEKYLHEN